MATQRLVGRRRAFALAVVLFVTAGLHARTAAAADPTPITYTIRFASLPSHLAEVDATFPTDGRGSIDLMLPIWSPGFYRVENYATRIQEISARTTTGASLSIGHPQNNRWHIDTRDASSVVVSYRLLCNERSVTTNFVGDDYAVLTGGATFITLIKQAQARRPHDVTIQLPSGWKQSMTGLDPTTAGYLRWLNFISHEYCHAFNVKRLRPVELGPFDYEREPHTESLWISEGVTSYFGSLAVTRAGLSTPQEFLDFLSAQIRQLQNALGRLVQTLAQSSLDVWTSEGVSGVNTNANDDW